MKLFDIGWNAQFLSKLSKRAFVKEVTVQLAGDKEKIEELYSKLHPQHKSGNPATATDAVQKEGGV